MAQDLEEKPKDLRYQGAKIEDVNKGLSPYNAGYVCSNRKVLKEENPFFPDTQQHKEWLMGYETAATYLMLQKRD